jgi:hypothetical protein
MWPLEKNKAQIARYYGIYSNVARGKRKKTDAAEAYF